MPTLIRPTTEKSRDGGVGERGDAVDAEGSEERGLAVMPVEEGEESTKAKALRQPYQPTPEEIAEHELTHIPFRDWCVHCMKGRGQSNQHRCQKGNKDIEDEKKVGALTTFSMDYMFFTVDNEVITKEEAEKFAKEKISFPVIVGKDRQTGAMIAHKVEAKGKGSGYIVKKIITDLESSGTEAQRSC